MTYDEILALEQSTRGTSGMSAEEARRREELIRRVAQHNPELAAQIARGPYQMQQGPTAQEAWSRGPTGGVSMGDVNRSQGQPGYPAQQPSTSGPVTASNQAVSAPPVQQGPQWPQVSMGDVARGSYNAPPQTPSFNTPAVQSGGSVGGQPTVNVNITPSPNQNGSYDPSGWYSPSSQFQLSPEQTAKQQQIYGTGQPPGGWTNGMSMPQQTPPSFGPTQGPPTAPPPFNYDGFRSQAIWQNLRGLTPEQRLQMGYSMPMNIPPYQGR